MRDKIAYKWLTANVFFNLAASWAYLIKIERIDFEQKESSVSFAK
jgi:hypothetical protein